MLREHLQSLAIKARIQATDSLIKSREDDRELGKALELADEAVNYEGMLKFLDKILNPEYEFINIELQTEPI